MRTLQFLNFHSVNIINSSDGNEKTIRELAVVLIF